MASACIKIPPSKVKAKYRADTMIKMLELFLFLEFIFMHITNTEGNFFFRNNQKSNNPHFLPRKKREKILHDTGPQKELGVCR